MKKLWFYLFVGAWLGCTGAWASEQNFNSVLHHRFSFYGGAQFYQADGEFSSTKDGQPKYKVDLDDLGLDEDLATPIFGARYNFSRRWTLRFDYFGYHDDAKTTAAFDFDFGDEIVKAGAALDSSLDLDAYVINLAYNLYSTERAKFGVGLGVHIADIDLKISSQATLNGIDPGGKKEEYDVKLPGPLIYATFGF